MEVSHQTAFRWDHGDHPSLDDVPKIIQHLDVAPPTVAQILALIEDIKASDQDDWLAVGPGINDQLAGVMDCERSASTITEWAPLVIPGTAQIPDYARATLSQGTLNATEIRNRLMLRMSRRESVLRRHNPIHLTALIGEPAINGGIGGPPVMRDQLRDLLEVSARETVTIRVVNLAGEWHPGMYGGFILYDFPASSSPSIIYREEQRAGSFLVNADDVESYRNTIATLHHEALSQEDSTKFIETAIHRLESATQ